MGKKRITISLSRRVYREIEKKRKKTGKDRSNYTEGLLEKLLFG